MRVRSFRALRPHPELAARVGSPPYDVVTRAEAARLAEGNPLSFLHVCRADIDLPPDVDPHDPRVYAKAAENLKTLVSDGVLVRDPEPALYCYRESLPDRSQTGLVACVNVDDYAAGVIRKHENTVPEKEDDRTRHILALGAHPEPVLLAYRGRPALDTLADETTRTMPLYDFATADGVRHTVWRVAAPAPWLEAFAAVPLAYVADGHHRSASALRAARELKARHPTPGSDAECDWFLAVLFPAAQLKILAYNRMVRDLGGQTPEELLARLGRLGRLSPTADPVPPRPGSFCFYLPDALGSPAAAPRPTTPGRWHLLELDPASIDRTDPIRSLDVALLQDRLLGPLLGIVDPRTDKRIEFVGGARGPETLQARVDTGEMALGVSMHPTTVEQLLAVADAGQIMPPKSTWFEPKLLSGLFLHPLDSLLVPGQRPV